MGIMLSAALGLLVAATIVPPALAAPADPIINIVPSTPEEVVAKCQAWGMSDDVGCAEIMFGTCNIIMNPDAEGSEAFLQKAVKSCYDAQADLLTTVQEDRSEAQPIVPSVPKVKR